MHPSDVPILERDETLPFVWWEGRELDRGYDVESYSSNVIYDRKNFERVQASIGWHVTEDQWEALAKNLVTDSMVMVTHSGETVATACAITHVNNWVELAWVAVSPKHRGLGIGKMVCSAVIGQLLTSGHRSIFGSTCDERLAAIKIYLDIGFSPYFRREKTGRWKRICQKLEIPYTPLIWGWPTDA